MDDELRRVLTRLEYRPASEIVAHDGDCCAVARAWFVARLAGNDALEWLRSHYKWGPSEWPLTWCAAARAQTLDCGALAALATTAFICRGRRAFPVQLVERFDVSTASSWGQKWREGNSAVEWIWNDIVYHEAVAVVDLGRVRIWDPTDGCYVEGRPRNGYGALLAMRIQAPESELSGSIWQGLSAVPNLWIIR